MAQAAGPVQSTDLEGFDQLAELALDMYAWWNHSADVIWRELDPRLWELTHDPWGVLQTVSRARLQALLADPVFRERLAAIAEEKAQRSARSGWFEQTYPKSELRCVAYFSMEFMLGEALPIYSGGLGNVAGDQLKAASDLGVPVVGIGLLYQRGYFRQVIDRDGSQQALFPYNDPGQLPVTPLRAASGEWLRIELALPSGPIWLRTWQVRVGRTKLYLLDSNDVANLPAYRGITSELYGGGPELRLQQELLLGLGGFRLLRALGLRPEVCHLNEGHAAFAVLERARDLMREAAVPFEVALATTRAGNVFTTHTAVPAGFDRFEPALLARYLQGYAEGELGLRMRDLLALGRKDPDDAAESFNMAYLALRGSGRVNAVSRLHGKVSRRLFAPLFPNWPLAEVPVGAVTNGVHMTSWDSSAADALWTQSCGKDRWLSATAALGERIRTLSDEELWAMRSAQRREMVAFARARLARELTAAGESREQLELARDLFDDVALTLGFARRFATYKRPSLLLHDPARLERLLNDPRRPLQIIIAGKAHPADREGQALIKEWIRFIRRPSVRKRIVFLSDYDVLLTERLVQGADLWLNTPRRPWEACGTSGMKALVNGGLNVSVLDGWWAEAFAPEVGWALGDGLEHPADAASDARDAQELYALLEDEIIPMFYARDERGIPRAWVARIRESMARLTPQFSAERAVREYTEQHYLPAARAYRSRSADRAAEGGAIAAWQSALQERWPRVRVQRVSVESDAKQHVFEVRVELAGLDPKALRVELFADGADEEPERELRVACELKSTDATVHVYKAITANVRPAGDFTARVIPERAGVAVPLEADAIRWQVRAGLAL